MLNFSLVERNISNFSLVERGTCTFSCCKKKYEKEATSVCRLTAGKCCSATAGDNKFRPSIVACLFYNTFPTAKLHRKHPNQLQIGRAAESAVKNAVAFIQARAKYPKILENKYTRSCLHKKLSPVLPSVALTLCVKTPQVGDGIPVTSDQQKKSDKPARLLFLFCNFSLSKREKFKIRINIFV